MSIEENKALVQRFYDAIGRRDFDTVRELCHPDFVFYTQIDTPHPGAEGFINPEKKNFDAFEEFRMPIKTMLAEGNKVAAYLVFEGKQTGECLGIPPSGNFLRFSLMMLLTIADGKIIEKRAHYDRQDIIRQLSTRS